MTGSGTAGPLQRRPRPERTGTALPASIHLTPNAGTISSAFPPGPFV